MAMTVRTCMRRRAVPVPIPMLAMSVACAVVPPSAMAEVCETAGNQERGSGLGNPLGDPGGARSHRAPPGRVLFSAAR